MERFLVLVGICNECSFSWKARQCSLSDNVKRWGALGWVFSPAAITDLKLPSWCFAWELCKSSKLTAAKGEQLLVKGCSARHQAVLCLPSPENKCCFPEQAGRMQKHPPESHRSSVCKRRWSGASKWKGKVIIMCWYHDGCFNHT